MLRFFIIIGFTSLLFNGCKKEKQEVTLENKSLNADTELSYEYAIDVPVNNPGVIIQIDSLTFFQSESLQKDHSEKTKNLIHKIQNLKKNFDVYDVVKTNTIKILDDNKYTFTIIDNFKNIDFPDETINKQNVKNLIDFKDLKNNFEQDDLILINVKNGFDYNEEDHNQYVAKTYVYIYILNSKHEILKFSESIAGTKYIEDSYETLTSDYLAQIMKQSIENTMDIIDKKY
ncbi:hypothetical protein [Faecalibacter bovis]|uniref:Lipoprotein n=1 Tax=Faecalibacter bovis TaxID=2898187 RepID=A0ABX7XD45_9FLAO|nr:hypothetical protein [Faecalibacter bovis]QTV05753.1 hypothetical protein J9309_13465 [Faecalibacter bovis]